MQKKYNIPNVYKNCDDAINDENVDIIYISTPHNTHIKYLIKALEKGKHVLCEKSITLNIDELESAKKIKIPHNHRKLSKYAVLVAPSA